MILRFIVFPFDQWMINGVQSMRWWCDKAGCARHYPAGSAPSGETGHELQAGQVAAQIQTGRVIYPGLGAAAR